MGESVQCPICTLYLHQGMLLEEHLETHPKEQVIQALVKLATLNIRGLNTSPIYRNRLRPNVLPLAPPPPLPPPTSTTTFAPLSAPSSSSAAAICYTSDYNQPFDSINHSAPNYHRNIETKISASTIEANSLATKNVMIVNRQNTLVYHHSAGNQIQPPQMQLFHYQPLTPKPMQPPPAYGAAISQLRSQNNQIHQQYRQNQQGYNNNTFIQNLQTFNNSVSSAASAHGNRISSRRNSFSPRVNYSPRPSPSPSVLRYAESPVTAHFTESDNGNFIVQESPRHVVEYIEKENGEMAVTEKIVEFKPSFVAIEETKPEPTPGTSKERDRQENGVKVLSNVQLNTNEYYNIFENLFPIKQNVKVEEINEDVSQNNDINHKNLKETKRKEFVGEDTSAMTSVIRATPGCSKSVMRPKRTPKKLLIKSKRLHLEPLKPLENSSSLPVNESCSNNKTELKQPTPSTSKQHCSQDQIEVKIEKHDENARDGPPTTPPQPVEIVGNSDILMEDHDAIPPNFFENNEVEEFTAQFHNDNSSIHVNFPTSSSSMDGSETTNNPSTINNANNCTPNPPTQTNETETKDLKLSQILQSLKNEEEREPLFPLSAIFSKPSTSTSVFRNNEIPSTSLRDNEERENQQQQTEFSSYSIFFSAYSSSTHLTEDKNKLGVELGIGGSASSNEDLEEDDKSSYLDLDTCKGQFLNGRVNALDALNIQTDEKMPAKGEISEQESNGDIENSWSQPIYNTLGSRFSNRYESFLSGESWSQDEFFHQPHDLSALEKRKQPTLVSTQRNVGSTPSPSSTPEVEAVGGLFSIAIPIATASGSSKPKKIKKKPSSTVVRIRSFQCENCSLVFPKLRERNAHLIKDHGYTRVNRRLYRYPPTPQPLVVSAESSLIGDSLNTGCEIKKDTFKLENSDIPTSNELQKSSSISSILKKEDVIQVITTKLIKKSSSSGGIDKGTQSAVGTSTKFDSIRAQVYRMLINFNLGVKKENTQEEIDPHFTNSKSFSCYTCKQDFISVKLFDEHLAVHPAECFTCKKKFTRWNYFSVHLKRHLGWKDFACNICDKKFVVRGALIEHTRMHSGESPLKCKVCNKTFKRYSNLTQHIKLIHATRKRRGKDYVCYCGAVLPSKARFLWHKEIHDSKPKCCPYCRDRFIHSNSLRRHIRLAHADKFDYNEPVECPRCNQIYSKGSIKTHLATHTMDDTPQHECNICNKSFSTKWNLKIHSWVHANRTSKPFKCDQCTKAFVREVDYKNHLNSHKQIKPFTCEYCGCKFIRKYNYMRHWREHQSDKKYNCGVCGKAFHRRYYLIEHIRIHTGERPFLCTICGKSSTTKTNHNKHLKIHHSRDPFTSET